MGITDRDSLSKSSAIQQAGQTAEAADLSSPTQAMISRSRLQTIWRIGGFFLRRIAGILLTIFIGIFITVMIANSETPIRYGEIDYSVSYEAQEQAHKAVPPDFYERIIASGGPTPELQLEYKIIYDKYAKLKGLFLPYLPRHLLWTWRALIFDLGPDVRLFDYEGSIPTSPKASAVIMAAFPRTLLLVGTAFFLLFVAGMPLSLYLFRKHGSLLDRFLTLLAPLSSVPAWVLGMVLVLIFSVGLHLLPPSGMFNPSHPRLAWNTIPQLLIHMILPVAAIFLSLFFQLLYTWKTFFLSFAGEDYVELAKAKGLPEKQMERQYILRPTVTYIITSFTLLIATFWQMSIALEYVFNWPGIGKVFIISLPDLVKFANTDASPPYYGVMVIVVQVVVLFAYILGLTALVLDIVYALVDPRFRIGIEEQTVRGALVKKWKPFGKKIGAKENRPWKTDKTKSHTPRLARDRARSSFHEVSRRIGDRVASLKPIIKELIHYPSAIFGLVVILLLVGGSIAAVTMFPYNTLGKVWYEQDLVGRPVIPRIAKPAWINLFRKDPLPSSMSLNSREGTAQKVVAEDGNRRRKAYRHYIPD